MTSIPELLVPAGNPEKLQTAILYGADAVYLGGETGNLRTAGTGFSRPEIYDAVALARNYGVKIYYCLNAYPFEKDMTAIADAAELGAAAGVDAFIVADPGVMNIARSTAPKMSVHLSTQANTTNADAVKFWLDAGVERVNLARELSFRDIASIRRKLPDAELEVFVHGAMCLAVSGQCLLSAWLNNRPANQGRCTQPCRFEYRAVSASIVLEEALRDRERLWEIEQGEEYASFFAPDDLCLLPFLPWFVDTRITSLKIEGRTKGASYVAHVTDVYRTALDCLKTFPQTMFRWREYLPDLVRTASRPLSTGFFLTKRLGIRGEMIDVRPLVAKVVEPAPGGGWVVDVRGKWDVAYDAELMLPGLRRVVLQSGTYAFENHRGEKAAIVNSGTRAVLRTDMDGIVAGIFIRSIG